MREIERKKWASLDYQNTKIGNLTSLAINGHYMVSEAKVDLDFRKALEESPSISRLVLIPDDVWERKKVQSLIELQEVLQTLDCYSQPNDPQDYPRKLYFTSPKGEATLIIYELRQWLKDEPVMLENVLKLLDCHARESMRIKDSYWQSRLPEIWIDYLTLMKDRKDAGD